jgi:sporulation protein YlmC with PRC-barrel domain
MKSKINTFLGAVAATALTLPGSAAEKAQPKQPAREAAAFPSDSRADRGQLLGPVSKASEVLGKDVKNTQGEKLGKVEDLLVDVETGRIVEVILSVGGVLGVGDKLVAVPPGAFTCEAPHPTLRLGTTKQKLNAAPNVEAARWEDYAQTNLVAESYRYFGQRPYFEEPRFGRETSALGRGVAKIEKVSKIIGATVKNAQTGEKFGKADNCIVDIEQGRLVHIIVSSGGVLGVGDELRAIPGAAFVYTGSDNTLQLNATRETLAAAPRFKDGAWPDFSDPSYSVTVYRAYQVEPYFGTAVDNTRRNVRDRAPEQVTPLDQGTGEADVDTTRRIRKEILSARELSVNARNIKVITVNGRVTLRGPVDNETEKRTLEEMAQRIAPTAKIDNQLEAKQQDR